MIDWNNFHTWQLVMPPSRPDILQLMRIRLLLRGMDRNYPIGILGSTPEFRDVCHEMGFMKIYVFDKNTEFYEGTKKLMAYPDAAENLVVGDWIETLPQYKNYFSAIISDLTMGNIDYEHRDVFYEGINRALALDGIFIDKVLMHDYFLKVSDLISAYAKKPLNLLTANYFNCQMLFCSELIKEKKIVDTSAIYMYLSKRKDVRRLYPLLELTKKVTPEGCIWYYGIERSIAEKSYLLHFNLLNCWDEPDYSPYYTFVHHYLLGKKMQSWKGEADVWCYS